MKAVLFDLDDTLHDKSSTLRLMAALQYESLRLGDSGVAQEAWLNSYVRRNNTLAPKPEVFALLAAEFALPEAAVGELLAQYDRECGRNAQPFAGMTELLEACRDAGVALGCVTNGRDHIQRSKLAGLGIVDLFDSVVTSSGFGRKKPDPAIFTACLSELGVSPAEAAFVGDNFEADMQPALGLGMHAIWKSDQSADGLSFASDSLFEIRDHLLELRR